MPTAPDAALWSVIAVPRGWLARAPAPLFALYGHGGPRFLGLITWIMMTIAFAPTLRLYGRSAAWGLALPLIAIFYAAATVGSAVNYWRGKGGQWKGRAQAGHGL